ncbi:MAG: hypothetical protein K2G45_08275 [Lachnospiraceae bacterium]|nr:hypothetical protein [Lachnospiraceae bacterium]
MDKLDRDKFLKVYWKQYQLMERDLIQTDDYVSIVKENYDTFSNQYMKLLLVICSEMDSIAEVLCRMREDKVPWGIVNKLNALTEEYPNLKNYRVSTKYPYDIKNIVPMAKFSGDSASDWWQAYNDIKHRRMETNDAGRSNYTKANLKSVLYAMAALYILNRTLYDSLEDNGKTSDEILISGLFENGLII